MGLTKHQVIGMPEDFPIIDADEEVEVVVSSEDIRLGRQHDPEQCAFARAERRSAGDVVRVEALKTTLYLIYSDHAERYRLTTQAQNAIKAFDDSSGKKMKPGTYVLKPITPAYNNTRTRKTKTTTTLVKPKKSSPTQGWVRGRKK